MDETIELSNLGNPPEQELEDDYDYDDDTSEDAPGNTRWHTPIGGDYEDNEDTTNLIDPREPNSGGRPFNIISSIDFNRNRARESFDEIYK